MKSFIVTVSFESGDHHKWEVQAETAEQAQELAQKDIDNEETLKHGIIEDVTEKMNKPKPKLKLVGEDGNAFAIIGRARNAARKAGWSKEQIEKMQNQATSGDYNNLLQTMMEFFDTDGEEECYEEDC